jgi:hypothetical protein
MRLVALLEYIPETGSLASSDHLYAGWLSLRLLARALCTVTPPSPLG